jgi:O-methyltransferase involved in polyketide biosynthesis
LTSYPFLTEKPCRAIEVDFDHVCEFKRRKIDEWKKEGGLPEREVEFIACDLRGGPDIEALAERLRRETGSVESVAFLEGITYYLPAEALRRLFNMLRTVQKAGSLIALDFWTPDAAAHPVHARFRKFCAARFGHGEKDYTCFDAKFLGEIDGYEVVEVTDIVALEARFSRERKLVRRTEILPEHYAVLERRRERR